MNKCIMCGMEGCDVVDNRCLYESGCLKRQLAQRTQERDNFRAVLSGEGYQNLDKIAAENRDCSQIGAEARRRTMEIIARADSAEAKLERIRVAAGKWKRTERYTDDGIPDAGDVALLDTLYAEFGKDGW